MENNTGRTIGPVTTAAGGGVAVAGILSWLLGVIFGLEVPTEVQTYMGIVFVLIAGFLVKPTTRGKRVAT